MAAPVRPAATDTTPPVVGPVSVRPAHKAQINEHAVRFTVTWSATDPGGAVASYRVRRSSDGGAWTDVPLPAPTATSIRLWLAAEQTHRIAVQAVDSAGNRSAWRSAVALRPRVVPDTVTTVAWTGAWRTSTSGGWLHGRVRWSTSAGANARFTFSGREVAWIADLGPTRGRARVYADGAYIATVDLWASTVSARRIVFRHRFAAAGTHRIDVRVSGTVGRPRVDVDGFVAIDPGGDPVIVGAGDIASCAMTGDSATAALLDRLPGTVVTMGDNAYEHGTAAQFTDCYHPTWGRHRARTRPVPGNHDYRTAGASGYFAYFGAAAGKPGEGWYAFDVGAWRIYALNSNCDAVGECGADSPQLAWLAADLAANPRLCVAAIWHHARFSSGMHGDDPRMADAWMLLDDAGAELALVGHDHDYERFAPQRGDGTPDAAGLRQFVVGTGGAGLRPIGDAHPNSEVRSSATHGVLSVTLASTGYSWSFVPVAGSTFTDRGSAACA